MHLESVRVRVMPQLRQKQDNQRIEIEKNNGVHGQW